VNFYCYFAEANKEFHSLILHQKLLKNMKTISPFTKLLI
jgi:hypothetical protein